MTCLRFPRLWTSRLVLRQCKTRRRKDLPVTSQSMPLWWRPKLHNSTITLTTNWFDSNLTPDSSQHSSPTSSTLLERTLMQLPTQPSPKTIQPYWTWLTSINNSSSLTTPTKTRARFSYSNRRCNLIKTYASNRPFSSSNTSSKFSRQRALNNWRRSSSCSNHQIHTTHQCCLTLDASSSLSQRHRRQAEVASNESASKVPRRNGSRRAGNSPITNSINSFFNTVPKSQMRLSTFWGRITGRWNRAKTNSIKFATPKSTRHSSKRATRLELSSNISRTTSNNRVVRGWRHTRSTKTDSSVERARLDFE